MSVKVSGGGAGALGAIFPTPPMFSESDLVAAGLGANTFWNLPGLNNGNPGSNAFAVGNLIATAYIMGRTGAIRDIGVSLQVNGGAGSQMRVGLYAPHPTTLLPLTLIPGTDSGPLVGDAGAPAVRSLALAVPLPVVRGQLLWTVYTASVGGPAPTILRANPGLLFTTAITAVGNASVQAVFAFAALPAIFPTPLVASGSFSPGVLLRFV